MGGAPLTLPFPRGEREMEQEAAPLVPSPHGEKVAEGRMRGLQLTENLISLIASKFCTPPPTRFVCIVHNALRVLR